MSYMETYKQWTASTVLTPAEQELVTLRIVGRLTHKETAKVLGITPASAQKRYDRAIQKLRETEELL